VKRLPKFASIVDRDVTVPSNIPIDINDRPHRIRNATIMKKRDTLLMCAPIHVHVLPFHRQQRHHPIVKEVLRQSKQPRHDSIMDRMVILSIDALTCVNYRPQPKATRIWHELWLIESATNVNKRVTLLTFVPICDTALMWQWCHVNSQLPGKLYRVYYPVAIPTKAPSNQRTRLCSSAAPGNQAHEQSSDSYCWEPEHVEAACNSKHHEGSN
jgi:hypothetical protein